MHATDARPLSEPQISLQLLMMAIYCSLAMGCSTAFHMRAHASGHLVRGEGSLIAVYIDYCACCASYRDVQRGNNKVKANKDAAEAAAAAAAAARKQAEAEEAGEEYERAPRHRMGGKGSAAEDVRRAEPLPVKLAGRLVYRTPGQSAESDVAVAQVGGRVRGASLRL